MSISPEAYLAGIPAVAGTALHAISLVGGCPNPPMNLNKAVLIHSAAGGVGGMLIQMCKLCGYYPIVAVVGSSHKIQTCLNLGADYVIDKSSSDLWRRTREIAPDGFVGIFDANGVDTLSQSYNMLCRCGRLVTYGFHTVGWGSFFGIFFAPGTEPARN